MDAGRAEPEVSRRVLDCTLEITLETGEDFRARDRSNCHATAVLLYYTYILTKNWRGIIPPVRAREGRPGGQAQAPATPAPRSAIGGCECGSCSTGTGRHCWNINI